MASFGTIKEAGAIDDIGGALRIMWNENHGLKPDDKTPDNPYNLKVIDRIKKEYIANPETTRKNMPELFYYFDGMIGTKVSQSVHPAGMVISPVTLDDNYGTFEKDGEICLMLNMGNVHEVGLAKYDFLILGNIKIINDVCQSIGRPYPKMHEIDFSDQNVWTDMLKTSTGVFQFESDFAHTLLKKFKPTSIFDMSLVTASVRPVGASYRNDLIDKIPHLNPSPIIDELLKDNNGYLIYQEDTIKFLQEICGLTGSEADNVRRAIGRKEEDRLNAALPRILDGYCGKANKPRDEAEQEFEAFMTILKDSASYQFGYNHSIAYCLTGYLCAYFRYYYPLEFITAYLNNASNDDDIINGTKLASTYGIKIVSPKYGIARDSYSFSKEQNVISKGVKSIKYLNSQIATELFNIEQEHHPKTFMELLKLISKTSVDSRQMDILLKIDFFSQFGNCRELMRIYDVFNFFKQGTASKVSRDKISTDIEKILKKYASCIGKNGNELKSYAITDMDGLLEEFESTIRAQNLPDLDLRVKIQNSLDCLGYIDISTDKPEDRRKLIVLESTPCYSKDNNNIWCYRLGTRSLGTGNESRLTVRAGRYNRQPIQKNDIIYADSLFKNKRGYWELTDYHLV